jgi:hypothetical protein
VKYFTNIPFLAICLLSTVALLFAILSVYRIGIEPFHGYVVAYSLSQLALFFTRIRRYVLILGAFQYFLVGLFLCAIVAVAPPLGSWGSAFSGIAVFLVCLFFCGKLLDAANPMLRANAKSSPRNE